MGNFWSELYDSRSVKLRTLNDNPSCKDAIKYSKDMIQLVIDKITTNWEYMPDYKKYHLYPGQEIFYKIYNNIHPAIYLYDGLIIEIGSGPRGCRGTTGFGTSFLGISSLKEYKKFGKITRKSPTWKVITGEDQDHMVMIRRLRKAKKEIGPKKFRVLSNNCVHIIHEIVFGHKMGTFPPGVKFKKITKFK